MLSREQLGFAKDCATTSCENCKFEFDSDKFMNCLKQTAQTALELLDMVEAQQKEINKLKIEKAIHRSALKEATEIIVNLSGSTEQTEKYMDIINNSAVVYHNPKDLKEIEQLKAELEFYKENATKIHTVCGKNCHMSKNIKLIRREVKDYPPYKEVIAAYEGQKITCPKTCRHYYPNEDFESIYKAIGGGQG